MRRIILPIFKIGVKLLSGCGIGKYYPIKVAYIFLRHHLGINVAEVLGHKMFLDPMDTLGISIYGIHEPSVTELVKKEVKMGDVVLDIGAHIGYYTLLFAKLVGKEGKVYAFEPELNNFALLEKNVKKNGYRNVVLVRKAVSNKTGNIRLYLSADGTVDHTVYDYHDSRKNIEIEAVRLDDYFKYYNRRVDFIKVDIQGAEGDALQGAANLLEKNENIKLITEFWPFGLKSSGIGRADEYLKALVRHGFKLYDINEQKNEIKAVGVSELLEKYTPEEGNYTNLLCLREK